MPVWTAFITHQIDTPGWASRDRMNVVSLADLQQYIFTAEYSPGKTSAGRFELIFFESHGNAPSLVPLICFANLIRCPRLYDCS